MQELYIKDKYDKKKYIDARGDVVIAKGGDGTLLRAINKFSHLDKPFFGIAAGTLNFLMNRDADICEEAIHQECRLIEAKVTYLKKVKRRNSFNLKKGKCRKVPKNKRFKFIKITEVFESFNEVMVGSEAGMNAWINFKVSDKHKIFGNFHGGGIIISTPQGSTGINRNAFGSILRLGSNMWSFVGDKTERRISHVITPQKLVITTSSISPIIVWVDGANHILHHVKKVELSPGKTVTVIFNNDKEFVEKRRI